MVFYALLVNRCSVICHVVATESSSVGGLASVQNFRRSDGIYSCTVPYKLCPASGLRTILFYVLYFCFVFWRNEANEATSFIAYVFILFDTSFCNLYAKIIAIVLML